MDGYRAVCPLCQTVIVSPLPRGTFREYGVALKAVHAHLRHSCDKAAGLKRRSLEAVADHSVEAIEGAA